MKALIFAAGLGTRLNEYTQDKPKALVEINGKTLLERAIEFIAGYDVNDITINVHHFADSIISFIDKNNSFGLNISISDERDYLLDTGGGLKKAGTFLSGDEYILVYNVDIISNVNINNLVEYHRKSKNLATLVVRDRVTNRKLMISKDLKLAGWQNMETLESKISNSELFSSSIPYAYSGIHIINPEIFSYINESGKFSIIDLYLRLAKNHKIGAFIDSSDLWLDVGKPEQLLEAGKLLK